MRILIYISLFFVVYSCESSQKELINMPTMPYLLVLGVAQDAGYPQWACKKECCSNLPEDQGRMVSSIALVDPVSNESWIFDASPDFTEQCQLLATHLNNKELPDGIFLTHGHIGHYTGLMFLGRESLSAKNLPVYGMPRMRTFLKNNGPWDQLVTLNNIELRPLSKDSTIVLNSRLSVIPIEVPHRDEYTETVGYIIQNNTRKALFIPDIDKWHKWNRSIVQLVKEVDIALLDATFFKDGEIQRDMNEVPHPFVEESMALFDSLVPKHRAKIYFTHFNHTNPLLNEHSEAQKLLNTKGYKSAQQEMIIPF